MKKSDNEWLTEMNLCHKCRKARPAPGRKFCFDCLEKIKADNARKYDPEKAKTYQQRRREIYQQKKVAGICVRCSKSATHGLYCYEHSIEAKRHSKANSAKRKRERHEKILIPEQRRQSELCLWCGKAALPGLECCQEHREKFVKAGKRGYQQNLINKNNPWINEVERWKREHSWKNSERI